MSAALAEVGGDEAVWVTDEEGHPMWVEPVADGSVNVRYVHPDSDHLWLWTESQARGVPYILPPDHSIAQAARNG